MMDDDNDDDDDYGDHDVDVDDHYNDSGDDYGVVQFSQGKMTRKKGKKKAKPSGGYRYRWLTRLLSSGWLVSVEP